MQAELYANPCKMCQQFKKRNTIYGRLSPTNIAELKQRDTVHMYLLGPYSKSITKHQTGGAIIKNNVSLTFMIMIDPATGWFKIFEVPTFDIDKETGGNN